MARRGGTVVGGGSAAVAGEWNFSRLAAVRWVCGGGGWLWRGAFTTPLLQFVGERLVLNFDGGAGGWLRVEVLDENGQAVQASEAVLGNGVCKEVSWQESIGKLAGTPVRLRFEMRDARLYALQFLR